MEKRLVSTSCLLIRFGIKACEKCQYVFRLWNARRRKRNEADQLETRNKKFVNERCLTRRGLEAKLLSQKKDLASEEVKAKRLARREDMIELVEKNNMDMKKILNGIRSDEVPSGMKLLWEMQIKQISAKSSKGHRWDPRIIRLALDIYCKSPKALDVMRDCIVLPSKRLLRYYKNSIQQKPGWNQDVINWCRQEAERLNLKEQDYWGGFIFDEMKIQALIVN